MRVMGELNRAGLNRVALVTDVERGGDASALMRRSRQSGWASRVRGAHACCSALLSLGFLATPNAAEARSRRRSR